MALDSKDEGIARKHGIILYLGAAVMFANIAFFFYPAYLHLSSSPPNEIYAVAYSFLKKTGLFTSPFLTFYFAYMVLGLYGWGVRVKKTSKYAPSKMTRWMFPYLVKMGLHPPFEYEDATDINGKPIKEKKRERVDGQACLALSAICALLAPFFLSFFNPLTGAYVLGFVLYILMLLPACGYLLLGASLIHAMHKDFETDDNDANNDLQESFMQCTTQGKKGELNDEYSVNLPTEFKYQGKLYHGWINVVNPFRATQVIGTPGSGKSYAVVNSFIRQHLAKHFCMYCYDFKFPDLSIIVYNNMLKHQDSFRRIYGKKPQFCVINFDNPRKSLRCNPISAKFLTEISDAYDSAYTIMLNLNKSWAQKQGDFFVESPINYLTSCIWYLKKVEGGRYCTLPHVVEFVNSKYSDCIPLMSVYPELNNYMAAFFEAWEGGAQDQLQGQIASVRIPLSRISSPELYWVMSGDDFTLDLNNPNAPKVLCVGNNPEKKDIYATALGLYNGRIVKIINKQGKHKITLIIDELPTMYFRGLDNLIATARSNKVATVLGYQDFSQLKRDYGDKEATAIINTIGNTFAGLVTGETAQSLEKQFGRNKQKRKSVSYNDNGESVSISEQNDVLIPASKIATLTQGTFVGTVSDNFGQEIEEKRFNAKIIIDNKAVKKETKAYRPLPTFYSFDTKAVAVQLRQMVLDYLDKPANFIANHILVSKNLPDRDFFFSLPSEPSSINTMEVINAVFTVEGSKNLMVADTLSNLSTNCLKFIMIHEGDLENASGMLLTQSAALDPDKAKDTLVESINKSVETFENNMAEYLNIEAGVKAKPIGVMYVHKCLDVVRNFVKAVPGYDFQQLKNDIFDFNREYFDFLRGNFSEMHQLKDKLQGVRDEAMAGRLKKNSTTIHREIHELIDAQTRALYHQNRDLWNRRIKACKLDELAEMKRLGMDAEIEEREKEMETE